MQSNRVISVGHINGRSISNKTDEIFYHAKDSDLDILAITGTWLCKDSADATTIGELTHGAYSLIHVPRPKMRGWGCRDSL